MADNNSKDKPFDPADLGGVPATTKDFDPTSLGAVPADKGGSSIADKIIAMATSSKVGKSLSGGLNSAVEATPDAALGAAEGATSLVGGAAKVGATGMEAADLANQAVHGKVPDMMGGPAKWREYKQMLQQKVDAASERSPLAFPVGEGLGMAAATPLIPELGGAKAISAAGKASPLIDQFLAGKAGGLAGKVAGKAAAGAIEGAPVGAVMGATGSNASSPEEFAADTASGIGMGSATGAALKGGSDLLTNPIKKAVGAIGNTDSGAQIKSAWNLRKDLSSKPVQNELSQLPGNYAQDFVERTSDTRGELGDDIKDAITMATHKGVKINVDQELEGIKQQIFDTFNNNPSQLQTLDQGTQKLMLTLGKGGLGDLNPIEAQALKQHFYDLGDKLAKSNSPLAYDAIQFGNQAADAIDDGLKSKIPDYRDATQAFAQFHRDVPELVMNKGVSSSTNTRQYGDLKDPENKLLTSAQDTINKGQLIGSEMDPYRDTFTKLKANLEKLKRTNPEAFDSFSQGDPDYIQKLQDQSDQMATLRQMRGPDPGVTPDILTRGYQAISEVATGSKAPTLGITNQLSRFKDWSSQTAPVKMANALFNSDDGKLMQLAQRMKNNQIPGVGGGLSFYGQSLEKALNNKSEFGKNAVLFKLMQIPEYRQMLSDHGYSDDTILTGTGIQPDNNTNGGQ